MTKLIVTAITLAACGWGANALALAADQVRGEIVSIDLERNQLELRVEASGDNRPDAAGQTETYQLPEDTEVTRDDPRRSLVSPYALTLEDLRAGNTVTLNFEEVDGQRVSRRLSVADDRSADASAGDNRAGSTGTSEAAALETERTRLPETASVLPALSLLGLAFAGGALALGVRRRSKPQ
jgi:LPXTG-motif cell wall-anchored protein